MLRFLLDRPRCGISVAAGCVLRFLTPAGQRFDLWHVAALLQTATPVFRPLQMRLLPLPAFTDLTLFYARARGGSLIEVNVAPSSALAPAEALQKSHRAARAPAPRLCNDRRYSLMREVCASGRATGGSSARRTARSGVTVGNFATVNARSRPRAGAGLDKVEDRLVGHAGVLGEADLAGAAGRIAGAACVAAAPRAGRAAHAHSVRAGRSRGRPRIRSTARHRRRRRRRCIAAAMARSLSAMPIFRRLHTGCTATGPAPRTSATRASSVSCTNSTASSTGRRPARKRFIR